MVIDCYNKSKTSSKQNGEAEIKTQDRRETDRMVGRRGGLQSIQRDGENWLQAAHILGCWFHFPHSAQWREEERCDAPRRYATQAQLKRAAQVWCNQWCTSLFVFESALYISVSSQPISSSCCHTCMAGKPFWNVLFAAAAGFSLHEILRCSDLKVMIVVIKQAVVHQRFIGFVKPSHLIKRTHEMPQTVKSSA